MVEGYTESAGTAAVPDFPVGQDLDATCCNGASLNAGVCMLSIYTMPTSGGGGDDSCEYNNDSCGIPSHQLTSSSHPIPPYHPSWRSECDEPEYCEFGTDTSDCATTGVSACTSDQMAPLIRCAPVAPPMALSDHSSER